MAPNTSRSVRSKLSHCPSRGISLSGVRKIVITYLQVIQPLWDTQSTSFTRIKLESNMSSKQIYAK